MTTTAEFFEAGKTYTHTTEDGEVSGEGIFVVAHVGRAPAPFEHHSETLGVAFGWRWGLSPNGIWEGLGSYTTPDFAGWVEIPAPPCGAQYRSLVCVSMEDRRAHYRHVAENGNNWTVPEPCGHDDCRRMECDPEPSVYCGHPSGDGRECILLAQHAGRTDHAYPETTRPPRTTSTTCSTNSTSSAPSRRRRAPPSPSTTA